MAFTRQEQQFFEKYCEKYFIPREYLIRILEDTKVVPMIRGKASEYNAFKFLRDNLNDLDFDVQKLNINAQPANYDEDVTITHRITGVRLTVEVKNAARGSFKDGRRCRNFKGPQFKVKCHKSRSNLEKISTTNDRYLASDFDIIAATPLNSIYKGATMTRELQFIEDDMLRILMKHYGVNTTRRLEELCNLDWRFAFSEDIAEKYNGMLVIPRTPCVALVNDEHWFGINELSSKLQEKAIRIAKKRK